MCSHIQQHPETSSGAAVTMKIPLQTPAIILRQCQCFDLL